MLGGYDGAYDHLPPSPSNSNLNNPSHMPYAAHQFDGTNDYAGLDSSNSKRDSNSKSSTKGSATKSLKNQVLKVDSSSLSTSAKLGIWLMGSSAKKLEKAAEAQKEKRRWEREEKRRRREEKGKHGAGGGGAGGFAEGEDDEDGFERFGGFAEDEEEE
jgi:hypothetical protein